MHERRDNVLGTDVLGNFRLALECANLKFPTLEIFEMALMRSFKLLLTTVGRKQGEADGIRMAAHLLEFLNGDAVAVAVQGLSRNVGEQISRQAELVKKLQLVDFLQHTGEAEGTDILFER